MTFPLKNGTDWLLDPAKRQEWVDLYGAELVDLELRKALQWLRDNEGRRKTERGMVRFLGKWLMRASPVQQSGNWFERMMRQ